jgi:hypothetical protein
MKRPRPRQKRAVSAEYAAGALYRFLRAIEDRIGELEQATGLDEVWDLPPRDPKRKDAA